MDEGDDMNDLQHDFNFGNESEMFDQDLDYSSFFDPNSEIDIGNLYDTSIPYYACNIDQNAYYISNQISSMNFAVQKATFTPNSSSSQAIPIPQRSDQPPGENLSISISEFAPRVNFVDFDPQMKQFSVKEFHHQFCKAVSSTVRFDKKIVQKIHNDFLVPEFKYDQMTRKEFRKIDIYFCNYYGKQKDIINFLQSNKQKIIRQYPELACK